MTGRWRRMRFHNLADLAQLILERRGRCPRPYVRGPELRGPVSGMPIEGCAGLAGAEPQA
jgi:hypothetical protein